MTKLSIEEVKTKIVELAQLHNALGDDLHDFKDAELLEQEVEQLIVSHCVHLGYLINGFPAEKQQLTEDELEEDYFCRERFQLYLDLNANIHEDIAELMWCYVSNFWSDQYASKEEYLRNLKDNLDSGSFYDVTI